MRKRSAARTEQIDLNRLEIFNSVVIAGSFSKAATQLKQPKSRISRNISALERELGVQLIYRTTRQFQLTHAGTQLFQKAAPLLGEIKNTLDQVTLGADEVAGLIKVTVPDDIGTEVMGEICYEFSLMYPKVRVHVQSSNQVLDLVKESIDLAVRVGRSKDSTMIQRKIGEVQLKLFMSPDFSQRLPSNARLEALEGLPFLAFGSAEPSRFHLKLSNGKDARTLKLSPTFSSNNFFVLRSLAVQGAGVALLPPFLAIESVAKGVLVPAFREWAGESVPLHTLMPHQKEIPIRLRKFTEFLTVRIAKYL